MGVIKCEIGGTDVSQYLKRFTASPGGDGRTGSATLYLTKQAAGLDIRPMMVVEIWESFNDAGAGVASRGRLFGGLVRGRDTSNMGTTKEWSLSCDDFNLIGTRGLVRDMQAAKSITLTAGSFKDQIIELTQIIQRNGAVSVNTEIDADTAVSIVYPTMPAVTYEGGHNYYWYIDQLIITLVGLNPTMRPACYLGTSITVGLSEDFGPPTLYLWDKASPPSAAFIFSDTPGVGEHPVYPPFQRKSASNEIVQRQQIRTAAQVYTGFNTGAAGAYPNPYINHGVDTNSGAWMDEPLSPVTLAQDPQAIIDRKVESAGYPRDSYTLETDQRLRNGEYVEVTWALEGLEDVLLQVVETEYRVEAVTSEVWVVATLNARRLRFGQSAEDDVYAPPVEGDDVPPLPPENFALVSNVYNPSTGKAELTFEWDVSPSPDVAAYQIMAYASGGYSPVWEGDESVTEATIEWEPGTAYEIRARAVDTSGNEGLMTDPALTGTAAVSAHAELPNPSFEYLDRLDLTKPRWWDRVLVGDGGAFVDDEEQVHGLRSLQLLTFGGPTDSAGVESELFMAEGLDAYYYEMSLFAKSSVAGETLEWRLTQYLVDGSPDTSRARSGSFTLTTDWEEYIEPMIVMYGDAPYMKLKLSVTSSGSREVWVDAITLKPKPRVTLRKNSGATVGTRGQLNFIEGDGVSITLNEDIASGELDITISAEPSSSTGVVGGYRDEFEPADTDTVVTLTYIPTKLMTVARNGVEQSMRAGHFTWDEDELTFDDAFDGTEELVVSYLLGGVTPVNPPTVLGSDVGTDLILSLWNGTDNDDPPADWYTPTYDDSAWEAAGSGTGAAVVPSPAQLVWHPDGLADPEEIILLRREFTLSPGAVTSAQLKIAAADRLDDVYVNGIHVGDGASAEGPDEMYIFNLSPALLLPDQTNIIAVMAHSLVDTGATSTVAEDTSGNDRNGTYTGTGHTYDVTGATGDSDGAHRFISTTGASGGYVVTNPYAQFTIGKADFTMEAWIKYADDTTHRTAVSVRSGSGDTRVQGIIGVNRPGQTPGTIHAETWAWQTTATRCNSTLAYDDSNWHYVVAKYTLSDNTLRLYVDNVLVDSATQGTTPPDTSLNYRVVGGWNFEATGQQFFDGDIDEIALYNTALSDARIAAHYAAAASGYQAAVLTDTPLVYLRLGDSGVADLGYHDIQYRLEVS